MHNLSASVGFGLVVVSIIVLWLALDQTWAWFRVRTQYTCTCEPLRAGCKVIGVHTWRKPRVVHQHAKAIMPSEGKAARAVELVEGMGREQWSLGNQSRTLDIQNASVPRWLQWRQCFHQSSLCPAPASGAGKALATWRRETVGGKQGDSGHMAMGHNLWLHFGLDEHPFATYFDVHQWYSVLTHSHIRKA